VRCRLCRGARRSGFLDEFDDPNSEIHGIREELNALFKDFHPRRKPVLWRLLVTQALLHEELLRAQAAGPVRTAFDIDRAAAIGDRAAKILDWRTGPDSAPDDEPAAAILVARRYVDAETARLRGFDARKP
jgi:hypothetical protein